MIASLAAFIFCLVPFHCLSVLVLLSCGLLMLMVIIWIYIFYCTLHFSFTTRQPLLSSPPEQHWEISTKSERGNSCLVFYLRKLSCGCGRGEGVGHHGAEYIQVIVVLACARATIVSWCSCGCVCDRKVKKLVLQVENKLTQLEKKNNTLRLFQQNLA